MSNVFDIRPPRRSVITVHRVTFDLVPKELVELVFYAAIAAGWAADEGTLKASDVDAQECLNTLQATVGMASKYTIPVDREMDEPGGVTA